MFRPIIQSEFALTDQDGSHGPAIGHVALLTVKLGFMGRGDDIGHVVLRRFS